jgi:adhesin/invasin
MSIRNLLLPATIAMGVGVLAVGARQAGAQGGECQGWIPPNTLVLTAGSPQQGQIGKPFQTNLQVQLANTNGCPLTGSWAGVSVVFTAPASGAGGTFASTDSNVADVGTDANGVASAPAFTANRTPGDYEIVASSSYGSIVLYLTNTAAGVAASIAAPGSGSQSGTVGGRYQPLKARVLDMNGQPVSGASVIFQLDAGATGAGASFTTGGSQASATTDQNGIATSPTLIANGSPGRFVALATTNGVDNATIFQLRNLAPRMTAVTKTETATVGDRFRRPLQARALDTRGRPVVGAAVTFTLPSAATGAGAAFLGGGTQATATTDARGRASSPLLVANDTAGPFTAAATIAAQPTPITFMLRNVAGGPATVAAGAASGESTPSGSRFPIQFAVTVTDRNGNPVHGVLVTFTAPTGGGPGGHFTIANTRRRAYPGLVARVRTNVNGVAVAPPFTANTRSGGYAVTARAGRATAGFALVNTPR